MNLTMMRMATMTIMMITKTTKGETRTTMRRKRIRAKRS